MIGNQIQNRLYKMVAENKKIKGYVSNIKLEEENNELEVSIIFSSYEISNVIKINDEIDEFLIEDVLIFLSENYPRNQEDWNELFSPHLDEIVETAIENTPEIIELYIKNCEILSDLIQFNIVLELDSF